MRTSFKFFLCQLLLIPVFLIGFIESVEGETSSQVVDSLKKDLEQASHDTVRFNLIADIVEALEQNPSKALPYCRQATQLARKINRPRFTMRSHLLYAIIHGEMDNDGEAIHHYQKVRQIADRLGNNSQFANANLMIGYLHQSQEAGSQVGRSYIDTALQIYLSTNDTNGIARSYHMLGSWHYRTAKASDHKGHHQKANYHYQEALEHLQQSIQLEKMMKDSLGMASSYNNIGLVYKRKGDRMEAIRYYKKSLALFEKYGDKRGIITTLNNIAFQYTHIGMKEKALEYSLRALELAKQIQAKSKLAQTYKALRNTYVEMENYKKAYHYLSKLRKLDQQIANKRKQKQMAQLEAQYEMNKKQRQIELLQKKNQVNSIIQYAFIGGFVLVLIIAFLIFNRYRLKKSANQHLKKVNDQLAKAKQRAEESEKFMEQFLANMSHEIRTPMNAVVGMTELLKKSDLNEQQRNYLQTIKYSADNLLVIINDILDLSKIEAGKMTFEETPFRPEKVAHGVTSTLQLKAENKGIELKMEYDDELPEVVKGDPVRLNQILINLLNNAIKFTKEGHVKLIMEQKEQNNNTTTLQCHVEDTGIGIPKEKKEQIFQSFQQADKETTRKFGGTGLGLTISQQLVQLQGGDIWVESEEGQGTTFSFYIPYEIGKKEELEEDSQVTEEEALEQQDLPPLKILLAEDNAFNQEVAIDLLKDWQDDITIDVAKNGEVAVEKLEENDYHLVLMDLNMPEMDGYEAAYHIRQSMGQGKKDIPIIALTAHATQAEREKAYSAGMNDYVIKPFKPNDLYQKITQQVFDTKESSIDQKESRSADHPKNGEKEDVTDLDFLKDFTNNTPQKMLKYIEKFEESAPENLQEMQKAFQEEKFDLLGEIAHKLKPRAGYMGAQSLQSLLKEIEEDAKNNPDSDSLKQSVQKAEDLIQQVVEELQKKKAEFE